MSDYDDLIPSTKKGSDGAPSGYDDLVPKGGKTNGLPERSPAAFGFKPIARAAGTVGQKVGNAIKFGHEHAVEPITNVLGAPQRGLEAAETGGDIGRAMTHQNEAPALFNKVKEKIGLAGLERGPLAGNDLGHKVLRGGADFGLNMVNDPLNLVPVGKIAKKVAEVVPGVGRAAAAVGHAVADSPVGALLNPDHYLRGLTPEAKATYEVASNKAMQAVRKQKDADDAIVRAHAAEIRAGKMPEAVAKLFHTSPTDKGVGAMDAWKKHFTDEAGKLTFGPGTRPQDVSHALFRDRAPLFKGSEHQRTGAAGELKTKGFLEQPSSYDASRGMGKKDMFDVPVEGIEDVQKRLLSNLEPKVGPENVFTKGASFLTHRGNQAFLANPVPHTFNLASLAYGKYGLPTTVRGMGNAARVMTGKTTPALDDKIGELQSLGAHSQYGNLFDEMGLTRILGIPGTEGAAKVANKAIIPMERASNYAQHKVLNSTETGLRAAALDAEKRGGTTGAAAAKNIHSTFGTDAPNKVVEGARGIGAPFAHFHLQTVPKAIVTTLAKNPARISNQIKANESMDAQVNPGGRHYHSSVPGVNGVRSLTDPIGYYGDSLGALTQLLSPYGSLDALKKGQVGKVAAQAASRFTPGSSELGALMELLSGKSAGAGDAGASAAGGYFSAKRP